MNMAADRGRRGWILKHGKSRRKSKSAGRTRLAQIVETLEGRTMLSAASIDVHQVLWNGELIEAVRDEYVLRMPQMNANRSTSVADFATRTPRTPDGWQIDSLGMGFYKLSAPGASEQIVTAWAQRQLVRYIEPNAVRYAAAAPNDPLYGAPQNWAFEAINAEDAWDTSTGSTATVVALFDTGIDYNHPDLRANMWQDPESSAFGFNAVANTTNPMDDNGHGTFAAGLIGAVGNNAIGMAGVNWTTQLMAVKVLNSAGLGTSAQVVRGVNYVINQKVGGQAVSTAHFGFARIDFSQAEFEALQILGATGVVIVTAAGNDGTNNDINPRYPASYPLPTLLAVAASTEADTLAGSSNFGPRTVHLAAPGVNVVSTRSAQGNAVGLVPFPGELDGVEGSYAVHSGTSYASAFVAGAAALLKVIRPSASANQIRNAILRGVDPIPALNGLVATGGRLNLANAVDRVLDDVGVLPVASFLPGQVTQVVEGDSGHTFLTVTVVLDRPPGPGKTAAVAYETSGGSAFENIDYIAQRGTLTFTGAQTERSIRLRIIGDRVPEPDKAFSLRLIQDRSRDVVIGDNQLNITIIDDDFNTTPVVPEPNGLLLPRVRIQPLTDNAGNAIPVREGDTAQFVIFLDLVSNKPITVRYRTHEPALKPVNFATAGRDYLSTQGTVTFRPGETSKIISVRTMADNELEVIDPATGLQVLDSDGNPIPEIFNVLLYDPVNAVLAGSESVAVGEIIDVRPRPPAPPPGAGAFTITVRFTTPAAFTTSQIDAFARAASRWEQIIVGDLPKVVDPATGEVIDDILIEAAAQVIDGPGGILGVAGPTEIRNGPNGLPWKGVMQFDTADLAELEREGGLVDVITHEMGHVLGFGTLWQQQGLIQGVGTDNPIFIGANAVREYNAVFGTTGTSVPVESEGGPGTRDGHWRGSVFGTELMVGEYTPGVTRPISRVTVGQFEDLGYQVNYAAADTFTPSVRTSLPGRPLPIRLPGTLPTPNPPVSTGPIGGLPVAPPPNEPVVVRPPINPPPPRAAPVPTPGSRVPITRVPVARVPVSTQPISGGVVVRQPIARQPVTAG